MICVCERLCWVCLLALFLFDLPFSADCFAGCFVYSWFRDCFLGLACRDLWFGTGILVTV